MSIQTELRKGELARLLIENEVYQETIEKVRQGIVDKWLSCPIRDREGQHELKLMAKLLDEITGHIQTTFETGKMAQIQLEQERKVAQLRKAGVA